MPNKILTTLFLLLACLSPRLAGASGEKLFTEVMAPNVELDAGDRSIVPGSARYVSVDREGLAALLERAPVEFAATADSSAALLRLPDPQGGEQVFRLLDSPILAPELAAQFPEIRTFRLQSVERPEVSGRGDLTPQGFHAVLHDPAAGMWYVDPLLRGDDRLHQIYWRRDLVPPAGDDDRCAVEDDSTASHSVGRFLAGAAEAIEGSGLDLRTYRLAVAATGEYTAFHGGTVALGMAAIVTAINRVNEIYEREVAIRMILVANNSSIVYTNGGTDPYTNGDGPAMLVQNQTNLNNVIGSANYDIGHVFATGGRIAQLGTVCGANKARGVSGAAAPIADAFYVDVVAHEMGHQWDANHTFNGTAADCAVNNASSAYEPGSGSTIMGFAGKCGSHNIATRSDSYFHRTSLLDIHGFSRMGDGSACTAFVTVGNQDPVVDAGADYVIPASTPFALTASGSDSDGSGVLTYSWEQYDLGPAGPPNTPSGDAPIFRSFPPTTSPTRTFPQVSDLVNNTQTIGEILPTYARTMNFRVTVRDNDLPAGNSRGDLVLVTVDAGSGPFRVTAPNTAMTWTGPGPHPVAWSTAGTTAPPVSCATVDIWLSLDGGLTFPRLLRAGAPNSGLVFSEIVSPNTTTARVKVRCAGNIFFDISNQNFTITGAAALFENGFESGNTSAWSQTLP